MIISSPVIVEDLLWQFRRRLLMLILNILRLPVITFRNGGAVNQLLVLLGVSNPDVLVVVHKEMIHFCILIVSFRLTVLSLILKCLTNITISRLISRLSLILSTKIDLFVPKVIVCLGFNCLLLFGVRVIEALVRQ